MNLGQSAWPFYSLANISDHVRNLVIQSNIMKRQLPGPHPFCYYYHTVIVSGFFIFLFLNAYTHAGKWVRPALSVLDNSPWLYNFESELRILLQYGELDLNLA